MLPPAVPTVLATAFAALTAEPATAHLVGGGAAHLHAGDLGGLAAVVALTVGAAWLERRLARRRARPDARRDRPELDR